MNRWSRLALWLIVFELALLLYQGATIMSYLYRLVEGFSA